jgi:crotonobetainyl-CoA:carnitine CoA-transferase CaiB-like acyl-CoA transferase
MTADHEERVALGFLNVLDLSENIAGQFCARMLADYGATVTLVEPAEGSAIRRRGPFREESGDEPVSILFEHLNLGKQAVAIDQDTTAGRDLVLDLARTADVIVAPAGFDKAQCRAANPDCIVSIVSPFGEDGPKRSWRGSEMVYQAMSGMMIQNGSRNREPLYGVGHRASYCAGIAAYTAILAALMVRERTGVAQDLAVDIAHSAAAMTYPFALQYSYNRTFERRGALGQPLVELKVSDGWIAIWLKPNDFVATCDGLGLPELTEDPRFARDVDLKNNFPDFIAEVQKRVADRKGSDVVAALQSKRVAAANCFQPTQIGPDAEHLRIRDFWKVVQTQDGPRLMLGPQFRMSRTPSTVHEPLPSLGLRKTGASR